MSISKNPRPTPNWYGLNISCWFYNITEGLEIQSTTVRMLVRLHFLYLWSFKAKLWSALLKKKKPWVEPNYDSIYKLHCFEFNCLLDESSQLKKTQNGTLILHFIFCPSIHLHTWFILMLLDTTDLLEMAAPHPFIEKLKMLYLTTDEDHQIHKSTGHRQHHFHPILHLPQGRVNSPLLKPSPLEDE